MNKYHLDSSIYSKYILNPLDILTHLFLGVTVFFIHISIFIV